MGLRYRNIQKAVSNAEMVRCLEREIRLRQNVYFGRVRDGKMSEAQAEREVRVMEAIMERIREFDEPRLL